MSELRLSYEKLPYLAIPFSQTHPDRLATLGKLFGMTPPDIETCRVLELGCGRGGNVVPMAFCLPKARFLGVDFSERQIEEGRRMVGSLGLTNIELRHADLSDVDLAGGFFDYVICHGIYSWVPERVRQRILAICKENLAPNGVAFVSYNTFPGWQVRGMLRDMMVYHSRGFHEPSIKLEQARRVLDALAQGVPADQPYGSMLKNEIAGIRDGADAYLFHEYLEEVNQPVYFHEFIDSARKHGLEYLADSVFNTMTLLDLPPEAVETLHRVAPDIIHLEQYVDCVRNRSFRQTLLVHQGVPIKRNLNGLVLNGLHVGSAVRPASPTPSLAHDVPESFHGPGGVTMTTGHAITKAAMLLLSERWPLGLQFEELVAAARTRIAEATGAAVDAGTLADDTQRVGDELLRSYGAGVIELRMQAPRLSLAPSSRPKASPVARFQAANSGDVTTLRHEPAQLDVFPRHMLGLLDGTRDREAVVAALVTMIRERKFEVKEHQSGNAVKDEATLNDVVRNAYDEFLPKMARGGLLLD